MGFVKGLGDMNDSCATWEPAPGRLSRRHGTLELRRQGER